MIVIDTSVLVDLFRGHDTAMVQALREVERDEIPFAIPAICCQELLQGARDEPEWALLLRYLDTQRILVPRDPWHTHREAARLFFDCRRRGITVRSSVDCLIVQLVLEHEGRLLHDDQDFERIKAVRPLKTYPT